MSDSCGVEPRAGNVLLPANAAGCELSPKPGVVLNTWGQSLGFVRSGKDDNKGPFHTGQVVSAMNCVTLPATGILANHSAQQMD